MTVNEFDPPAQPPATPAPQPLEHYRVPATARLPAPDERGLRTFKGRHYVDLPDGLVVQVATDAQTGLVRATLANERLPSGPELVRDAISGRWEVRSDLEPILFPLSASRLEAFRTALDFTGVEPGGDGTFHHDNKLYVVIGEHAYQVLHDADSSSPSVPVLQIVRTEDPVAHDEGNRYVASARVARKRSFATLATAGSASTWQGLAACAVANRNERCRNDWRTGLPRLPTACTARSRACESCFRRLTSSRSLPMCVRWGRCRRCTDAA